ncbi:MAG: hypothetical protein KF746_03330 [Chitinophagaceae bacterium]|nr:hypothetical protein [Chitinophagaceae bacterium]
MNFDNIRKSQVIVILALAFLFAVILRIPNLMRPLSKHHEYLPAVVLMNTESWNEAGGGHKFHYTPVMNYQNTGDKYVKGDIVTQNGNIVYLSIGPGWYIIPYSVFKILNIHPSVTGLRILNLFFGLLTMFLFIIIIYKILPDNNNQGNIIIAFAGLSMLFLPAILWYFGNGYTHTGIMLPFALALAVLLLSMINDSTKIKSIRLVYVIMLLALGIYIDWFALFLGISSILICLSKLRESKKYITFIITIIAGIFLGISLIFLQFSSYAGIDNLQQYWTGRFFARANLPLIEKTGLLLRHYCTSYLPLLIGVLISMFITKRNRIRIVFYKKEILFIFLWGTAIILYHIVLFNWSFVHEFSVLPSFVLLIFILSKYLSGIFSFDKPKLACSILTAISIISILQYYYINPPGKRSLNGTPYDLYEKLGNKLRQINGEHKIFMHMPEANPMIEYYAKRNITNATDTIEVKQLMKAWQLKEAVWIEAPDFNFQQIIYIHDQ